MTTYWCSNTSRHESDIIEAWRTRTDGAINLEGELPSVLLVDLARAYVEWGGYAYGGGVGGESAHATFETRLRRTDAVIHNQDNREHDLLDSDDYYQFEGGAAAAVATDCVATPYHALKCRGGMKGGERVAVVGVVMAGAFRLYQGGPGGVVGTLVIVVTAAVGLAWRHYNASLLNYDDLVGYPVPDGAGGLDYLRTPATIWDAEAVFFDETGKVKYHAYRRDDPRPGKDD